MFSLENVNHTLVFETKGGDLAVSKQGEGYLMDFPLNTPDEQVGFALNHTAVSDGLRWRTQGMFGDDEIMQQRAKKTPRYSQVNHFSLIYC